MAQKYYHFALKQEDGQPSNHERLIKWHESLYDNKGERAGLRRCAKPDDVLMTEGFRSLYRRLYSEASPDSERILALACAAGVLSHVKEHDERAPSFAKQMATKKEGGDKPIVSELRLNQLQKSYSWEEFYRRLVRTVKMLDAKVNIVALTDAILHWGKEFNGEFARKATHRLQVQWAADYYQVLYNDNLKQDK